MDLILVIGLLILSGIMYELGKIRRAIETLGNKLERAEIELGVLIREGQSLRAKDQTA